jgi:hypothetical protein
MPLPVMDATYKAAWAAYYNALHFGRTEQEARASAVTWAQLPIERYMHDEVWPEEDD